jgi:hypothetical protein
MLRKVLVQWSPYSELEGGAISYNFGYAVLVPFAANGVVFGVGGSGRMIVMLSVLVFAATTAVAVVTMGDPRFRYPTEPLLVLLAASGLVGMVRKLRPRYISAGIAGVVLAVNAFLALRPDIVRQLARAIAH